MKKTDREREMQSEFVEFIEISPVVPSKEKDRVVMDMVSRDLHPTPIKVYSKFALIQSFSGLLTLTVCPQFGFGFGQHNQFLHTLHAATTPIVFYLLCGVFFVLLGAIMSGGILNQDETRTVGSKKFVCFAIFSVFAYLVLVALGSEAFAVSSLVWILGAFMGNILGFEATTRLRLVLV